METWDALRARRQVREFTNKAIDPADLDRVLEAARRTPSSRNTQPWDFIVVTDREQLEALTGVWRGAWHVGGAAAAVAFVTGPAETERARVWALFDLGMAAMALQVAAADLGIGSGIAAVDDQDVAREILGFPDDHLCFSLLSLGYPADRPLRPIKKLNRKSFDEVVRRGRW